MSGKIAAIGADVRRLDTGWTVATTAPGLYETPTDLPTHLEALPAQVPGTLAGALEAGGQFDRTAPRSLENLDAWYLLDLKEEAGNAVLRFEGLATIAEVYFNGKKILDSDSMFETHDVAVELSGSDRLAICFRAIGQHLDRKGPRARWRPRMMRRQGLRMLRTTALGFMPGWCPDIVVAGPWRPISLIRPRNPMLRDLHLTSRLREDGYGVMTVLFAADQDLAGAKIACAGYEASLACENGAYRADLLLPDVEPWWPHTHGRPALHEVTLTLDGTSYSLGRTGFRRVEIDRGPDGRDFAVVVNGRKVFCRGAVWTSADIVYLPGDRQAYAPTLHLAAQSGMNMIRIGGTMTYETSHFFELCDELGLMVWQDLMLANFDYPANDPALMIHVKTELTQLLEAHSASPSFAVLCGGSEMQQQAAMLGLPERIWKTSLTEEVLPAICAEFAPDLAYVPNAPSGGALPFYPNEGVANYYGVGAYLRPLEDARRANVRFAAECLAFSNVPEQSTLDIHLPVPAVHDPRWKARVPRDSGTSWDFEDVRDHYLGLLYDLDPTSLRRSDPERYLAFSRAVTAEVMEAVFAEWRHPGSSCNGAMVWTLQDLLPGASWGLIDATGLPKSPWYALKRAFRPVQLVLSDEGTNGLDMHLINETGACRSLDVQLTCLRHGVQTVVSGNRQLQLDARSSLTLPATDLFGSFFDTNHAFRFGAPSHNITIGRLIDTDTGEVMAEAFHFPLGRASALEDSRIDVSLTRLSDETWAANLNCDRFAQTVTVTCEGFLPDDNYFHLAPGLTRSIQLKATSAASAGLLPSGSVSSLGGRNTIHF